MTPLKQGGRFLLARGLVDTLLAALPLLLAQHELLHFAGGGLGQRAEFHRIGALEVRQTFAAFTENAADQNWVASYLTQFFGVALIVSGLVTLSGMLTSGGFEAWAQLGLAGSIANLAVVAYFTVCGRPGSHLIREPLGVKMGQVVPCDLL